MKTTMNVILAASAAMAMLAAGALLDGPSEAETQAAQAADLEQAREQSRREAILRQRCHALRGPRAELVMIHGTDDYACRVEEGI